jgi:L1 cell adhesion molecule like protein
MENTIIGIDLGTTYSCAAVWDNTQNKIIIIPNELGSNTTPSWVSFTDEKLVGQPAKSKLSSNASNTVYDSKRLIGKYFNDSQLQNDLKHFPFKVKCNETNNKPQICVTYKDEPKEFYPEEISAFILSYMKGIAEAHLGHAVTKAVVTVPAYFNDAQRRATQDAGTIAGLDIVRIINEPTAAAIAYGLDNCNDSNDKNILVFDLGGGTFDLSILRLDNGLFEVKATLGDTHLGGEDFDNNLVLHCLKEFKTKNPNINTEELVTNKKVLSKLKSACETAKKNLSSTNTTTIEIDSLYDGIDFCINLTRTKFEMLCESRFNKCLELVQQVLKNAQMEKDDISDIVLIGGSTRIPKIREILKNYFGKDPKISINPDEAVAYGAAVQGAVLGKVDNEKLNGLVLVDIVPLSLGIETSGGVMVKIIERGSTIPCSKSQIFSTYSDNQPSTFIKIFEGERDRTCYNNLLGTFELTGIAPKPRGMPKINVKFEIDANGILSVSAHDESVNKVEKMVINNDKNKFNSDELMKMIADAEKFAEDDKLFKERITALTDLENYVYNSRNILNTEEFKSKVSEEDCKVVNDITNEILMWIENNNNGSADDFKEKLKELKDIVSPIFMKSYGQSK